MTAESPKKFTAYQLDQVLSDATFSHNPSIPPCVRRLNLGELGLLSEKMIKRGLKDVYGRERGRPIVLKKQGKLTVHKLDILGPPADVDRPYCRVNLKLETLFSYQSKKPSFRHNLLAGFIHTHGHFDLPASPADFYTLFSHIDTPGVAPMMMVVTPRLKSIYFRGPDTPQWSNPDLSEQISYWDNWLNCQKNKIISDKMSDSEKIGHISILNYSFIRQLRYDFGIRSFSCPLRQNIAIEDSA